MRVCAGRHRSKRLLLRIGVNRDVKGEARRSLAQFRTRSCLQRQKQFLLLEAGLELELDLLHALGINLLQALDIPLSRRVPKWRLLDRARRAQARQYAARGAGKHVSEVKR